VKNEREERRPRGYAQQTKLWIVKKAKKKKSRISLFPAELTKGKSTVNGPPVIASREFCQEYAGRETREGSGPDCRFLKLSECDRVKKREREKRVKTGQCISVFFEENGDH